MPTIFTSFMNFLRSLMFVDGVQIPAKLESAEVASEAKFFDYNGIQVTAGFPHLESKMEAIMKAPKFTKWLDSINPEEIDLQVFTITDVDFFGPPQPNKLGFVKGTGVALDKECGERIPAIVFIRGGAVAVLIVVKIKETGKKYVLLCKQLRFPCGGALVEACAGMIDSDTKNVVGVVFKEVNEETGFVITEQSLIELGQIIPSGGGCDEIIHLYAWETEITEEEFAEKQQKVFGDPNVYERIKLIFYDFDEFDDFVDGIGDVKAVCSKFWQSFHVL